VRVIEVELPPDVVPRLDDGPDQIFLARARREGGAVLVSWESTQRHAGGAVPGAGRSDETAVGCVRVEVETGKVMTLPAGSCADAAPSELPATVLALARTGAFATPPQRIGDTIAATAVDRDAEPPRTVLRRWHARTAVEEPMIPLGEGQPVAQLASPDRRQLLIASRVAPAGYRWAIADLRTGTLVGALRRPTSAAPFCILGGTLVHTEQPSSQRIDGRWITRPLRLVALDLSTGAERWIRSLRDTAYRGSMPPRL
jgi:hypothetical protein